MATNNIPAPEQVPVPDFNQLIGDVAGGTRRLGSAATDVNINDRRQVSAATIADILLGGGASLLDPTLQPALDAYAKQFSGALKRDVATQAKVTPKITAAKVKIADLEKQLADQTLDAKAKARIEKQLTVAKSGLTKLQGSYDKAASNISAQRTSYDKVRNDMTAGSPKLTDLMAERYPEAARLAAAAQPYLNKMGQLGPAGERLMGALGQGFQANQIGTRDVSAVSSGPGMTVGGPSLYRPDQISNINAARVANVQGGQVGEGQLGSALMGRALQGINLAGRLGEQEARDAVQSARQAFAARGLATSGGAIGAELLNRSRYQRQREMQDLAFATGVQEADTDRQRFNLDRMLEADKANQIAATNLSIADQRTAFDVAQANQKANQLANEFYQTEEGRRMVANQADITARQTFDAGQINTVNTANANRALTADTANEEARRLGNTANIGMLGDAYTLQQGVNQEGLRGVGIASDLASAANPYNMAMGLYQGSGTNPGTAALNTAGGLGSTYMTVANDANQFNANSRAFGNYAPYAFGNYGNQQSGGGINWGALMGGALIGGAALAIPGGAPFAPAAFALGSGIGGSSGR